MIANPVGRGGDRTTRRRQGDSARRGVFELTALLNSPILTSVARKTLFRRTFGPTCADKAEGIRYSARSY